MASGCALTQGYELDCNRSAGGLKEVYIIRTADIDSITEVSGVVTAITKKTGARFYKYRLPRETSNSDEAINSNEQNGTEYYGQTINLILNKRQASVRNEVMILAKLNVTVVTVENGGKNWLFGRDYGLSLATGNTGSGTTWADRNGYNLPLTGNEPELAPEVEASVIATLETPGA